MFDIYQPVITEDGYDERAAGRYIEEIVRQFAESSEGQAVEKAAGDVGGWAGLALDYAFSYEGTSLPELTVHELRTVLFDIFPRKVSTEAESAPEIIAELRAFWEFLGRQYALPHAGPIVRYLDHNAEKRLREELGNPENFGMAKSFFMAGQQAGFDMTTEEGLRAFQMVYNAQLGGGGLPPLGALPPLGPPDEDEDFDGPVGPITPPGKAEKARKKQARKAARKARKRNRR